MHQIQPIGPETRVSLHFLLFCYGCKLGAKWAELVQLMQKIMPRSRLRIFRNECTIHPIGP